MKPHCKVWFFGAVIASHSRRYGVSGLSVVLALIAGGCSTSTSLHSPSQAPSDKPAPVSQTMLPPDRPLTKTLTGSKPSPSRIPAPVRRPRVATTSEEVAGRLGGSFSVLFENPETLLIRRADRAPVPPPALFEEAILLGQIRATLNAATLKAPDAKVTFHNGSAAMGFPHDVNPGTACVVIAKILALEGVNEVRARFNP